MIDSCKAPIFSYLSELTSKEKFNEQQLRSLYNSKKQQIDNVPEELYNQILMTGKTTTDDFRDNDEEKD